jgi:hypothetical protein
MNAIPRQKQHLGDIGFINVGVIADAQRIWVLEFSRFRPNTSGRCISNDLTVD